MSPRMLQWLLTLLFFCLNLASVVVYAITADSLGVDLKLTTSQSGSLGGSYFIAYALSQLLLGSSLGRIPPRLLLGATALIAAGGAFLLSVAQSFELAMLSRLLMGVGFGTAMVGVVFVICQQFSNKFTLMLSLSQGIATATGATLGLLASLPILQNFRQPFLITAVLLLINSLLMFVFIKAGNHSSEVSDQIRNQASLSSKLLNILGNGQFWLGTIYFTGLYAPFLAYADLWNIKFQMDVFGSSSSMAAMINSGATWGLAIGGIITGIWANKVGFIMPARTCAFMSLIVMGILYTKPLPGLAVPLMIVLGFFMGAAPLGLAVMNANVPEKLQSLASPILLTVVFLSGGVLMSAVGSTLADLPVHEFGTYQAGLNWFLTPIGIAAAASLMMKPGR